MIRRTAITEMIIPDLETSSRIMAKIIVKSIIKQAQDEKAKGKQVSGNPVMDRSDMRRNGLPHDNKAPRLTATERFILNHNTIL